MEVRMNGLFKSLAALDWSSLDEVSAASETVLRTLAADKDLLSQFVEALSQDSSLLSRCEHYDLLDKLVLHDNGGIGFRLRLHLFLPGYFDRPHNHRWSYSSLLLRGSYRHYLFGDETGLSSDIDVSTLQPIMVHEQHADDFYTLHHRMVHSVVAEPYTVSLIIRGPSLKNRFLVMDRVTNEAWWQYGMAQETPEQRQSKVMSPGHFRKVRERLSELGVIHG